MRIRTITGALRKIAACKTHEELVRVESYLSRIAWNDGGAIRQAAEERRSALWLEGEPDK
jgi:uncharacterized protein (UPF0303 family)